MNCKEFENIFKNNVSIIDLRDKEDFLESHIPNSKNVNHIDLVLNPDKYLLDDDINYLICDRGEVSNNVIKLLSNTKFKLVNIIDGFDSWKGPTTSLS